MSAWNLITVAQRHGIPKNIYDVWLKCLLKPFKYFSVTYAKNQSRKTILACSIQLSTKHHYIFRAVKDMAHYYSETCYGPLYVLVIKWNNHGCVSQMFSHDKISQCFVCYNLNVKLCRQLISVQKNHKWTLLTYIVSIFQQNKFWFLASPGDFELVLASAGDF